MGFSALASSDAGVPGLCALTSGRMPWLRWRCAKEVTMTLTGPAHRTPAHPRPNLAVRKFGYLIAITLNAVFFYLINVEPGWQVLPFLTPETPQVLALLNFSVIAAIVINTAYLLYDAPWCRALGDFLLAVVGLAVLERIWRVFPFTFTGWPVLLIRTVLVVAIVGTVVAMIVNIVQLVRHFAGKGEER
jgi:hypothetical protein